MKRSALLVVTLAACLAASAQQSKPAVKPATPSPLCAAAEASIEQSLKEQAYAYASGVGDNSAPRETNRQLRMVAASSNISNQLTHMQALGCPAFQREISYESYRTAALECVVASEKADIKAKCAMVTWQRDPQPTKP